MTANRRDGHLFGCDVTVHRRQPSGGLPRVDAPPPEGDHFSGPTVPILLYRNSSHSSSERMISSQNSVKRGGAATGFDPGRMRALSQPPVRMAITPAPAYSQSHMNGGCGRNLKTTIATGRKTATNTEGSINQYQLKSLARGAPIRLTSTIDARSVPANGSSVPDSRPLNNTFWARCPTENGRRRVWGE